MAIDEGLDGLRRVVLERFRPEVDCGRFPIKRVTGERVVAEIDAFTDGHDQIVCRLLYRRREAAEWRETPMAALGNDRWRGEFEVGSPGGYVYTAAAWVDAFLSFRHDIARREDESDIGSALEYGAGLVDAAARRAEGTPAAATLATFQAELAGSQPLADRRERALDPALLDLMLRYPDRTHETRYARELEVSVDRPRARFSTWYELFPRSTAAREPHHGTLTECLERLPYVANMGFDVLYLPPIHPIGRTNRKGPDNALVGGETDPGSPWAIGSAEGGHKAVHPALGTLDDFGRLVAEAKRHGIEIALDIAFQCAPDHPYVRAHPEWFRHWPDGTIQYAENPPKKYQDIYPFDFETADWRALWKELKSVFEFWIDRGVKIFRVDNPHTKAFPFWEWAIDSIRQRAPDVIFLSEAFTRPRVLHRLAKLGFTQSYTYFTWRNTKQELVEYSKELAGHESREYLRPNLWPNTPDILHEYLQFGGRAAFVTRVTLAATLGANYGIYGPAFEILEREPRAPGTEEYRASEKYEVRHWNLDRDDSLAPYIARLNRIRHENAALQSDWSLRHHHVDNEQLICYSKHTEDFGNVIITVVNLDPHHRQSGFVELPLGDWKIEPNSLYQVHDLLSDTRYLWEGARNYVELDPQGLQAHVFRLRRRVGTESDFDYFL